MTLRREAAASPPARLSLLPSPPPAPAVVAPLRAIDPVCGMSVEVASARHTLELDGVAYYFCCARCRERFAAAPAAHLAAAEVVE